MTLENHSAHLMINPMGIGGEEVVQVVNWVSREKGIRRDDIFEILRESVESAAQKKYGTIENIRAEIDIHTGYITLYKVFQIVEKITDKDNEISINSPLAKNKQIGDVVMEPIPPVGFERVIANVAKSSLMTKLNNLERYKEYEAYKDRVGEIMSGKVERIAGTNAMVRIGNAIALLKKRDMIPGEEYVIGKRVRAYVKEVVHIERGPQIVLSRTDEKFLEKLMEQEIPEIYDGVIKVRAVARMPGTRAKMAVFTSDHTIDPIGPCIGLKGSRIRNVSQELCNENIDIIEWSDDLATFVKNVIAPANTIKIIVHDNSADSRHIHVVVSDDELSRAIGKKGQNVILASKLLNMKVSIFSESQESERHLMMFQQNTQTISKALDVEEVIAQLLIAEGYREVIKIAEANLSHIARIEGFDDDIAEELINRARDFLQLE